MSITRHARYTAAVDAFCDIGEGLARAQPLALATPDGHPLTVNDLPGIVPEIDPTTGPQPAAMSVILTAHGRPLVDLRCWSAPEAPNWNSIPLLTIAGPYRLWADVYAVPQPTPAGAHHEVIDALQALAAERPDHPGGVLPRLWTLLQARVRASAATTQAAADALRELAGDPDPLIEAHQVGAKHTMAWAGEKLRAEAAEAQLAEAIRERDEARLALATLRAELARTVTQALTL